MSTTDAVTVRKLTTGEVKGSGLYDELMRTGKAHILEEFENRRLTNEAYSTVYLGMLQANLAQASQFLLQVPIINKQVLLLDQQILQAEKQNELLELQKEQLRIANLTAQHTLDVTIPKQDTLLDSQISQAAATLTNTGAELVQIQAQTAVVGKQEDLLDEQIDSEKDKTSTPTAGTNWAQYNKLLAEIAILEQKKITEQKQTTGTSSDTEGLVGIEMALKENQADSFIRDAEQKAMKIFTDIFSVMYATEAEGLNNQDWGFGSDEAFKTMTKLMAGISAGLPTTTS